MLKELGELRNDTSTGPDNLPVKFIKHCADILASPITHILNSCIDLQLFPSPLKISRICPIPKVDTPVIPDDFRPIAIVPALSKVYERLVLRQLLEFVEKASLLGSRMSGFRKGHSTTT